MLVGTRIFCNGGFIAAIFLGTVSIPVQAAPEEIQVYLDEFAEMGKFGLDLHSIYTATSRLPSGTPPNYQLRLTPELSYGLSEHVETAAYFLTNHAPGQSLQTDGLKVRMRYRPLIPTEQTTWYTAVNIELGKLSQRFNTAYSNGEIKGILAWRSGPWVAGLNVNIDRPLRWRTSIPTTLEIDTKLSRRLTKTFSLGVENYAFLGPLRGSAAGIGTSRTTFVVSDFSIKKWDVNFGIGRASGDVADKLIIKSIIGIPF